MPFKYRIVMHRRVQKSLNSLKDKKLKLTIIDMITKLENYPLSLREMDTEKVRGLERTFRVRTGRYRLIFLLTTQRDLSTLHIWKQGKKHMKNWTDTNKISYHLM